MIEELEDFSFFSSVDVLCDLKIAANICAN